jgi:16S rRNA G966 N2-methylase RsmD
MIHKEVQKELEWLFTEEAQNFLKANADKNPESFLLSKALSNKGWDTKLLVRQLKGLRVALSKFPTWHRSEGIVYPASISLEQSSSEFTAKYKATLAGGARVADLSGGMGIDSYFLSRVCNNLTYIEPSKELFEITMHNFYALGATNINGHCCTAEDFLKANNDHFSCLYLDPSRRKGEQRIAAVSLWEPDVMGLKGSLWNISDTILIKMSPMVDITEVCKELGEVKEVHVVSHKNECKEVLLLLSKGWDKPYKVVAAVLTDDKVDRYEFYAKEEQDAMPAYSEALLYIYEPDVALLKSGAFKKVATDFNVSKIHAHTHLYTSKEMRPDFMGRCFQVEDLLQCNKKNISNLVGKEKDFHVITRNAALTADQVKAQWKLIERGNRYLILFKSIDGAQYIAKTKRVEC